MTITSPVTSITYYNQDAETVSQVVPYFVLLLSINNEVVSVCVCI